MSSPDPCGFGPFVNTDGPASLLAGDHTWGVQAGGPAALHLPLLLRQCVLPRVAFLSRSFLPPSVNLLLSCLGQAGLVDASRA